MQAAPKILLKKAKYVIPKFHLHNHGLYATFDSVSISFGIQHSLTLKTLSAGGHT